MISKIINFFISMSVGRKLQEATMDDLYPNRPRGLWNNFKYNHKKMNSDEKGLTYPSLKNLIPKEGGVKATKKNP